jgi:hypothetical protein
LISSTDWPAARPARNILHPADRPEQIDRGRPRRRHLVAEFVELNANCLGAASSCCGSSRAQCPSRAATPIAGAPRITNRLDRARDIVGGLAANVDFLSGSLRWSIITTASGCHSFVGSIEDVLATRGN